MEWRGKLRLGPQEGWPLSCGPSSERSPRVRTTRLRSMPAVFTLHTCRDSLGLCLVWQTRPMLPGPQVMRFVFLRLEFCSGTTLQIPPRGGHPCLRLAVGAITLRSGLGFTASPPSRCPCRAHQHKDPRILMRGSFPFFVPSFVPSTVGS